MDTDQALLLVRSIEAISCAVSPGAEELTEEATNALWWGIYHLAGEAAQCLADPSRSERGQYIHLGAK